uniref:Uncharacterized protein n=1 Tax=Schistosoma japonicum TaxID=6182 RepID=Q5DHZ3_SCHJA|nr:unknown [Schistosoma japonicum]
MKVEQNSTGISNTVQIVPLSAGRDRLNIKYLTTKYCSKETSEQACRDASIHGVECYWCIKPEICTNKVDTNAYNWIKNNCDNVKMSEDGKSNPSLSNSNLSPTETTSTSPTTSKQEATRETTMSGDTVMSSVTPSLSVQNKNSSILLIIIISVGCLLILLIVLAIWFLTSKKLHFYKPHSESNECTKSRLYLIFQRRKVLGIPNFPNIQ